MTENVKLSYESYPEKLACGTISLPDDKEIYLSIGDGGEILIRVVDRSFGAEYENIFALPFETAKDFYEIFYRLMKQVRAGA